MTIHGILNAGILLLIFGAAVVRKDGRRASRFRVFWRSLVTWVALSIPAVLVAIPLSLAPPTAALGLFSLIIGGLAAWSALMPDRGIPDRLAGTRLVAR